MHMETVHFVKAEDIAEKISEVDVNLNLNTEKINEVKTEATEKVEEVKIPSLSVIKIASADLSTAILNLCISISGNTSSILICDS